jgi:hypothetical protein
VQPGTPDAVTAQTGTEKKKKLQFQSLVLTVVDIFSSKARFGIYKAIIGGVFHILG